MAGRHAIVPSAGLYALISAGLYPTYTAGGAVVRKILLWLFVAFLIYFAANHPLAAAAMIKFLVALLGGLATGLSNFAAGLVPS